ncbi:MAG: YebC/PmpR family DNA-binding transcriptional regulator [Bdellovibrionota bacterium]|nr:MAG: YebC/PmpR family DNA-binding transcriptional regulator [Bdellovibrionota bacterium]
MGRIFEKRKYRMFARWAKTAKAFTKIGKEIAVAVKLGGPHPEGNPRLRMAIQTARSLNMPKDRVESAIKRAVSKEGAALEEIVYEGYAKYGVAVVVEAATDNPTRTVAVVRGIFSHHGGQMATTGALDYLFQRRGVFTIDPPSGDLDQFELDLIDIGLEDIFETDEGLLLYTSFEHYGAMQRALEERHVEVKGASVQRIPLSTVELNPEQQAEVEALINALEEDDDVQNVFHNVKAE